MAWWVPLYHTVEPVRALTLGTAGAEIWTHLFWTLVAGVVFYMLAVRLMRRRLIA
jgi:ABC-type polysaccharide/polyol phosphate export permease